MVIKSPSIHLSQPFSKAPAVPAGLHTNHICSVFISGNKQPLRSGSQNVLRTFRDCLFLVPRTFQQFRNVWSFFFQNILGMFVFGFQNVLAMLFFFVCSQNILGMLGLFILFLGMLDFGSKNVSFWFPEHCRNVRFIYFISGNVRFWFQEC